MLFYLASRIALAVPVLFGVTLIVFVALRLTPGDPALALAGMSADASILDALRKEYGLDHSIVEQYVSYMQHLLTFDLGRSTANGVPVAETLAAHFPTTLILAVGAMAVATLVGLAIGVFAARFQQRWQDYTVMVLAIGLLSVPNYVLGLLLVLLFSVRLGVLPAVGASTPAHYILPVITIAAVGIGVLARQTRSAVLEVMNEDYVRTARGKGLDERRVLVRHALRNALIPIVTSIGLLFGNLLSGTVIVEAVFNIPGVGGLLVDSIAGRDYPIVQGAVLLVAGCYVVVNLLVDVAYGVIDVRVRPS